jgi:Ser/Thr protein kinase RdoA (MazF antagonist)
VSEQALIGGDINAVVRIGNTVRRPMGEHSPGVHAFLRHLEAAGFEGAPRFLGIDEQGREMLSYVEGEPGFAPVPAADDVLFQIGGLLRELHGAAAGFVPPPDARWAWEVSPPEEQEVMCHLDLFWTNVIFRDGTPVALIDFDIAAPASRTFEVVLAASYWAPLRAAETVGEWGLPLDLDRRGERLRLLCDGYGLERDERAVLLGQMLAHWRRPIGHFTPGAPERRATNARWLEAHCKELERWL